MPNIFRVSVSRYFMFECESNNFDFHFVNILHEQEQITLVLCFLNLKFFVTKLST